MTEEAPADDTGAIIAANRAAADFYRTQLGRPTNPGPREYLRGRGFEKLLGETRWAVGYSPRGWTSLTSHLLATGVSEPVLEAAGLSLRTRNGRLIDRFRDRLTFGIRDEQDQLVGFTARCAPRCSTTVPKYLNTPRTFAYNKSAQLFGLGEHVRTRNSCEYVVVVEGPLDAIAVDLACGEGAHVVAPLALCGTAMSSEQARLVEKLDPHTVVVALDRDRAGYQGAERVYQLLRDGRVPLLTPNLPFDEDVADHLARGGTRRLRDDLESVRSLADELIDARLSSWADVRASAERELCCLRETATLIVQLRPSEIARQARRLTDVLGLPLHTVTRELIEAIAREHDLNGQAPVPGPRNPPSCCPAPTRQNYPVVGGRATP